MAKKVLGNTGGMKKADLELLLEIYSLQANKNGVIPLEAAQLLAAVSGNSRRELAVLIDRRGKVVYVGAGDADTVQLQGQSRRRGEFRLSGLRCIHTHPSGSGLLSLPDYAALSAMRLDAMVALGVQDRKIKEAYIACLDPQDGLPGHDFQAFGPMSAGEMADFPLLPLLQDIETKIKPPSAQATRENRESEKAILATMESRDSLEELARLAETAGAIPVAQVLQQKSRPDAAFFIGRGKVKELALLRQSLSAELIIFDEELTPTQARNLQNAVGCRIIDRTALILDIFARRARTREGKLQVELAQLNYLLPRLTGMGTELSRLGGGIGTRGPGETRLETDRRHIRRRIEELDRALEQVRRHRKKHRQRRQDSSVPVIALVGYTNAGKSTLLNALTGTQVFTANQMFATLDPTTRRLQLPDNQEALLTDTVGFIRKLPHHLVAAFRATLEEVAEADLLLHVVDAGHNQFAEQAAAVESVLKDLGAREKNTILVLNKIDRPVDHQALENFKISCRHQVAEVSAKTGTGLEELKQLMARHTSRPQQKLKGWLPHERADLVALLYQQGVVYNVQYAEKGIWLEAAAGSSLWSAVAPFLETPL